MRPYTKARILYALGRHIAARKILDELVLNTPDDAPALFLLGKCLIEEDKHALAQGYLRRTIELSPANRQCKECLNNSLQHSHKIDVHIAPTASLIQHYEITTILHLSGPPNVGYQGNMWLRVLEQLNEKVAIVIRDKWIAKELNATPLPVFYMRTALELEALVDAGVRVVLYPGNPQKNTQMLRFINMQHYFINHGESDKIVNQSKLLRAYDKLLVAGPMAERRLTAAGLRFLPDQIEYVGRPQASLELSRITQPTSKATTVLYAPTWEGFTEEANYSSIGPFGLSLLEALTQQEHLRIIFKPHPYTGTTERKLYAEYLTKMKSLCTESNNLTFISSGEDIHPWMNESDILITDISSILNEYLYTLKPIVLTMPSATAIGDVDHWQESFPSTQAAYLLSTPDSIHALLDDIMTNDSLFEQRQLIGRESLGDSPETSLQRFDSVISAGVSAHGNVPARGNVPT